MSIVREALQDILKRCPSKFDLLDLSDRVKEKVVEGDGPYCVVVAQECTRLNALLEYITFTLDELQKGLNGQLNMSSTHGRLVECPWGQ